MYGGGTLAPRTRAAPSRCQNTLAEQWNVAFHLCTWGPSFIPPCDAKFETITGLFRGFDKKTSRIPRIYPTTNDRFSWKIVISGFVFSLKYPQTHFIITMDVKVIPVYLSVLNLQFVLYYAMFARAFHCNCVFLRLNLRSQFDTTNGSSLALWTTNVWALVGAWFHSVFVCAMWIFSQRVSEMYTITKVLNRALSFRIHLTGFGHRSTCA